MAPARRILARWITALTVNGSPASVTISGDLDLAGEGALVAGDMVGRLGSASWIDSCTWSRPASASFVDRGLR